MENQQQKKNVTSGHAKLFQAAYGQYKILFGKYKGIQIKNIDFKELTSYVKWLKGCGNIGKNQQKLIEIYGALASEWPKDIQGNLCFN